MWNFMAAAGFNTTERAAVDLENNPSDVRGPTYFASTITVEWQKKYGRVGSWGFGLHFHYDGQSGRKNLKMEGPF